MEAWHRMTQDEVAATLRIDLVSGLTEVEAEQRFSRHGPNELEERGRKGPWRMLLEQATSVMVVILIVAAVVSALVSDYKDAVVIMAIVVLFVLLGFFQEFRAERAMAALKKMSVPYVRVKRGGELKEVSARHLVVGDLILLETGNVVPADCRLIEAYNFKVQESALTGESEAVEKVAVPLEKDDIAIGDRRNMAYMGTVVSYGRATAIVVETGMATELGRIAEMIQSVHREQTPLQRRLDQLGKMLAAVAVAIAVVIFFLGLLRGEAAALMMMTAVSVAVAAIPEGLPAVLTITLALGAQRMLRRNALIRKLPAVETLGSVTVICSDKTGTLTENRMTVTVLDVAGHKVELTEPMRPVEAEPRPENSGTLDERLRHPALLLLIAGGALCNDAVFSGGQGSGNRMDAIGDPTETALITTAAQFGLRHDQLLRLWPRVAEVPFDSDRKRMLTIHELPAAGSATGPYADIAEATSDNGGRLIAFAKGAVDSLLTVCDHVWADGRVQDLNETWHKAISRGSDELASQGMRVLGVAFRPLLELPSDAAAEEKSLVFVGMVGMIDPPRAEVKEAVAQCVSAGIRPVMITGDHPLTALQIATWLGISSSGKALTGQELARLSADELLQRAGEVSVYARVAPEQKLDIVGALQRRGEVVAMTGDGVNDAPALTKANIGVAMGIAGTDVAREAADMVLRDDNFATIVAAVKEGRVIYDNIRKFIKYSVAGNIGKIFVILVGPLLGLPLPLMPLQLLWLNLLTDGLLGLGMGVEPAELDTMSRPPVLPGESIFARGLGRHIMSLGFLIGIIALVVGIIYWHAGHKNWQTMVFTTITMAQVFQAFAIRSDRHSLFAIGALSNRFLALMALAVIALQLVVVYLPVLQGPFATYPLSAADLFVAIAAGSIVLLFVELEKLIFTRKGT